MKYGTYLQFHCRELQLAPVYAKTMDIVLSHEAALRAIRSWRTRQGAPARPFLQPMPEITFPEPGGMPRGEVGRRLAAAGLQLGMRRLDVLCHSKSARVHSSYLRGHVLRMDPARCSALRIGRGVYVCGPALMLAQLGASTPLCRLIDMANELMGSFSRKADDACGEALYGLSPFMGRDEMLWEVARLPEGTPQRRALLAISLACPNAWSPRESVLAIMLSLPLEMGGYDLGPLLLNDRLHARGLVPTTLSSRVPDIRFPGMGLGLNYDGEVHLDLSRLERAAVELGLHPGDGQLASELKDIRGTIRRKYVDDRRRDRDLLALGLKTLTVTSEDLLDIRSLDLLALQVIQQAERRAGRSLGSQRQALASPRLTNLRNETLATLLERTGVHPI